MNIQPGEKIIEIGVGTGLSFRHYNQYSHSVSLTGIDLSDKMLEKARHTAVGFKKIEIDLMLANGENTSYHDSTFDRVVLMYVYSVTPDPEKMLREAFRICKDSGSVHIINHFSNFNGNGMTLSERLLSRHSHRIGFRSHFPYSKYITGFGLEVASVKSANLFGLTKIIHLPKAKNPHILSQQ